MVDYYVDYANNDVNDDNDDMMIVNDVNDDMIVEYLYYL